MLGHFPVSSIPPEKILDVMMGFQKEGKIDKSYRIMIFISLVVKNFSSIKKEFISDPTVGLDKRKCLTKHVVKRRPTITDIREFGKFLVDIDDADIHPSLKACVRIAPLVAIRSTELRMLHWSDIKGDTIYLPAERMKGRQEKRFLHIVPLSEQVVQILEWIKPFSGGGPLVFPGINGHARPWASQTINNVYRRLGYPSELVCHHGLRSTFTTTLLDLGWDATWISRQLAHAPKQDSDTPYTRTDHLFWRRVMMHAWADTCDTLKYSAKNPNTPLSYLTLDTAMEYIAKARDREREKMRILER